MLPAHRGKAGRLARKARGKRGAWWGKKGAWRKSMGKEGRMVGKEGRMLQKGGKKGAWRPFAFGNCLLPKRLPDSPSLLSILSIILSYSPFLFRAFRI